MISVDLLQKSFFRNCSSEIVVVQSEQSRNDESSFLWWTPWRANVHKQMHPSDEIAEMNAARYGVGARVKMRINDVAQ